MSRPRDDEPAVHCVDVAPRDFNKLHDQPSLLCKKLSNGVVLIAYDAAALGDQRVLDKGATVVAIFHGTSSGLRFGFFYKDLANVDESLQAALARCRQTTDGHLTQTLDRWGALDVPFCNLHGGSATERPADEAVHAGATLLSTVKYGTGRVLDYVRQDGQTVAVVVKKDVLPQHVGAALARAIRDRTCVAMYCNEDVHPCAKTSVFYLALEALRAWTWTRPPVALPEVPRAPAAPAPAHQPSICRAPTAAPATTVKRRKTVHNVETPQVFVRLFRSDEPPKEHVKTVKIPWAEPPHLEENKTGVTDREKQSAKWKHDGWEQKTTKTMQFDEQHTVESWWHPHYGPGSFSRSDMKNAVLKIDNENNVFAHKGFYPVRSHSRGPHALFYTPGSNVHLTRAEVCAQITAAEDSLYKAAGFVCTLVNDDLRFRQGGAMPEMQEWSHPTYAPGITFERYQMPGVMSQLHKKAKTST